MATCRPFIKPKEETAAICQWHSDFSLGGFFTILFDFSILFSYRLRIDRIRRNSGFDCPTWPTVNIEHCTATVIRAASSSA